MRRAFGDGSLDPVKKFPRTYIQVKLNKLYIERRAIVSFLCKKDEDLYQFSLVHVGKYKLLMLPTIQKKRKKNGGLHRLASVIYQSHAMQVKRDVFVFRHNEK
jgi:hypothetical protein